MFQAGLSSRCALLIFLVAFSSASLAAQILLSADGQTDTYTLINHTLGGTAEEVPDCGHPAFGPHITQASDGDLGKAVFVFHIHVSNTPPDNDRCSAFDRQRNEIKTYGPSPAYLKGFANDSVTFRWKFKLDTGFQPSSSFTHIHQIKAGDGDDQDAPLITLTPRAGNPQQLQLIHVSSTDPNTGKAVTTTLARPNLAPFKGVWVEAYEKITYGSDANHTGTYSIEIRRVSDKTVLFTYSNNNLDLWRTGSTFIRPKWGIYRSLNNQSQLRDEQVRFDRYCLAKGTDDCISNVDFKMTATPDSQKVTVGSSTSFNLDLASAGGFNAQVNLSVSGLPNGASASFGPSSVTGTGSSMLSISTDPSTPTGSYQLTITGAGGAVSHSLTVNLAINPKANPVITWSNPADIVYGTPLSDVQLNARADVAGAFVYAPPEGTILSAGLNQMLSTFFTPTDTANYNTGSKSVAINVLKATPLISWTTPADIVYGTALSGVQLNATANVPGSFAYVPPAGTVLNAGLGQTLAANFSPADNRNYNSTFSTVNLNVLKATPSFSNLSSPVIIFQTPITTVSGKVTAGALVPPSGETVTILVGGITQSAQLQSDGSFAATLATGTLLPITPAYYPITYSYAGDNNFNAATGAGTLTVLGPRDIFQNVFSDLTVLRTTVSDQQDGDKLDAALAHLGSLLDPALWLDQIRLQPQGGNKVLSEVKDAVNQLAFLLKGKSSVPDAVTQSFIDHLILADRLLVVVAISDATSAGVNPNKAAQASDELAKGDADLSRGKYDSGLEHYRNAWEHAEQVDGDVIDVSAGGAIDLR